MEAPPAAGFLFCMWPLCSDLLSIPWEWKGSFSLQRNIPFIITPRGSFIQGGLGFKNMPLTAAIFYKNEIWIQKRCSADVRRHIQPLISHMCVGVSEVSQTRSVFIAAPLKPSGSILVRFRFIFSTLLKPWIICSNSPQEWFPLKSLNKLWGMLLKIWKRSHKTLCGSRGSCMNLGKLSPCRMGPKAQSLEKKKI